MNNFNSEDLNVYEDLLIQCLDTIVILIQLQLIQATENSRNISLI